MIEEEDDDDYLKKSITFKSVLKNGFIITMMILGAILVYSGNYVGIMFICFASMVIQVEVKPPEPIRQTLTILFCKICNLTTVRNYKQGDYVFKHMEKCSKCDDIMEIRQIYSVKLKKPTEESEKQGDKKLSGQDSKV